MYVKSGQANVFIKLLCIRFIHGIGHGEFFHYRLLKKLGYFQPPNGDTDYGYSLSYISEDFLPLPIFDISETPERPQILIKRGGCLV
ncbi:MAG: hypothetical protein Q8O27_00215 [Enterobacteriaceae bacterium]|nr:hypothetical protein [Enterobacteriaceae bacterium]